MQHRWPVKSPGAYPVVARRGPGGIPRPLVERDVETVAAWTLALSAFLPRHAAIFKADTFIPLCESYFDDTDREVRCMLTLIGEVRCMLTFDRPIVFGSRRVMVAAARCPPLGPHAASG